MFSVGREIITNFLYYSIGSIGANFAKLSINGILPPHFIKILQPRLLF